MKAMNLGAYVTWQQCVYEEKKGTQDENLDIPTFTDQVGSGEPSQQTGRTVWEVTKKSHDGATLKAKDNQVIQGGSVHPVFPVPVPQQKFRKEVLNECKYEGDNQEMNFSQKNINCENGPRGTSKQKFQTDLVCII